MDNKELQRIGGAFFATNFLDVEQQAKFGLLKIWLLSNSIIISQFFFHQKSMYLCAFYTIKNGKLETYQFLYLIFFF